MFRMSRDKLQLTLRELEQAVYNHRIWYKDLIRSIACHLPPDTRDLAEDAHHHCRFGQWYYAFNEDEFAENMTFKSIEIEHRKMHELAAELLRSSRQMEKISPIVYDNFANTLERLGINIETLKHEIEETLYNRDPLTGARNRVTMLSDLRRLLELAQRGVQQSLVCIMDLDHFKSINDTYGHQVGDQVLVAVTEYILSHMRPYDKLYRFGGEEFLIVMPHTDIETAEIVMERIREGLATLVVTYFEGEAISVTGSFGIAELSPGCTVEESMDRADRALYRAKEAGRNRVSIWSDTDAKES